MQRENPTPGETPDPSPNDRKSKRKRADQLEAHPSSPKDEIDISAIKNPTWSVTSPLEDIFAAHMRTNVNLPHLLSTRDGEETAPPSSLSQ
jgi:hypothetical protein